MNNISSHSGLSSPPNSDNSIGSIKKMLSTLDFQKIYRETVDEVIARMPSDWSAIAKHNVGWRKGSFDARQYLLDSELRYLKVLKLLPKTSGTRILDVGGFLAAFPLTLRRLGYDVTIAEKFDYYDKALDGIAQLLTDNNVSIIDADFTEKSEMDKLKDTFDVVT